MPGGGATVVATRAPSASRQAVPEQRVAESLHPWRAQPKPRGRPNDGDAGGGRGRVTHRPQSLPRAALGRRRTSPGELHQPRGKSLLPRESSSRGALLWFVTSLSLLREVWASRLAASLIRLRTRRRSLRGAGLRCPGDSSSLPVICKRPERASGGQSERRPDMRAHTITSATRRGERLPLDAMTDVRVLDPYLYF